MTPTLWTNSDLVAVNLLTSTLISSCFLLLSWLALRCKTWLTPAFRNNLWFSGLLMLGWFTMFGFLWPHVAQSSLKESPAAALSNAETLAGKIKTEATPRFETIAPEFTSPDQTMLSQSKTSIPGLTIKKGFVWIWLLGFLGFFSKSLWNTWRARCFVKNLEPGRDERLERICCQLATQLGIKRLPSIWFSHSVISPMVSGLFKAKIIMPQTAKHWDLLPVKCSLAHELAHVKRYDLLQYWLGTLIVCCHWFNPMAWLALAGMRQEREEACDRLALALDLKPSDYASTLLHLATQSKAVPRQEVMGLAMVRHSQIGNRIRKVLTPIHHPRFGSTRLKTFIFIAILMGGLPLTSFKTHIQRQLMSPSTQLTLAEKEFKKGHWARAAIWFEHLERNPHQKPAYWYRYAFCLEQAHQKVAALNAMQTALQLAGYPDSALFSQVVWLKAEGHADLAQKAWADWQKRTNPKMMMILKSTGSLPEFTRVAAEKTDLPYAPLRSIQPAIQPRNPNAMEELLDMQRRWSQRYPETLTCKSFRWAKVFGHQQTTSHQQTVWFEKPTQTVYTRFNTENLTEPTSNNPQMLLNLDSDQNPLDGVLSCSLIINEHGVLLGIAYRHVPHHFNRHLFESALKTMSFQPGRVDGQAVTASMPIAIGFSES